LIPLPLGKDLPRGDRFLKVIEIPQDGVSGKYDIEDSVGTANPKRSIMSDDRLQELLPKASTRFDLKEFQIGLLSREPQTNHPIGRQRT
jgi:hypothetical protein